MNGNPEKSNNQSRYKNGNDINHDMPPILMGPQQIYANDHHRPNQKGDNDGPIAFYVNPFVDFSHSSSKYTKTNGTANKTESKRSKMPP